MTAMTVSAQEHMKFMGIPIDGDIEEFSAKLMEKEFTLKDDENNIFAEQAGIRYFDGCFFNTFPKNIIVGYDKRNDNCVWNVCIEFNVSSKVYNDKLFAELKKSLKEKYGTEKQVVKNGYKACSFETKVGAVMLSSFDSGDGYCDVTLIYSDKANFMRYDNSKKNDL